MEFPELDRGANIDQPALLTTRQFIRELLRRDGWAHDVLLPKKALHCSYCRNTTTCLPKKLAGQLDSKSSLNARHNIRQVRLGDGIVHAASLLFGAEKAAPLHESQVFRCHMARYFALLSKFTHGMPSLQQELHHPQPVRMG
jgi:hypothetical protein